MKNKLAILSILSTYILFLYACGYTKPVKVAFDESRNPPIPDYSMPASWAALPDMKDSADHIPNASLSDMQSTAIADVFFIQPTGYFTRKHWNASVSNAKLIKNADKGTMMHQASVFNGSCRIYAPRYRQATYQSFFSLDNPDAQKAFDLAYADVKSAFEYYMAHYNNGRPIIIASHSQGTVHARWLLQEFFDGQDLQTHLIGAYLIGMPVYTDDFTSIYPCDSADDLSCFVSWRSYLTGHLPKPKFVVPRPEDVVVINPLTWTMDTGMAASDLNLGGLGKTGKKIYPGVAETEIKDDILWTSKPDIPGKIFLIMRNFHPADYNLYWMNIRQNVQDKVEAYKEAEL